MDRWSINIKKYIFKLKYCDIKDFDYDVNDTFYNIKLNKFYCPIINETTNYTLEGLYTDKYFKFIEIIFKLNEYSKNNLDEVKEFMKNNPVEMIIYLMDSSIDYENRLNPISKYINEINKWLDFENRKETQITYSDVEFEDDQHYYLNSIKKINIAYLDNNVDTFRFVKRNENLDDEILGTFIIKASYRKIKYKRIYQKLPSFLAHVSGLIELTYLISFFIVRFLDKILIDKIIINKMFKFRGNNNFNFDYLKILCREDELKNNKLKNNNNFYYQNKKIDDEIDNENYNNNNEEQNPELNNMKDNVMNEDDLEKENYEIDPQTLAEVHSEDENEEKEYMPNPEKFEENENKDIINKDKNKPRPAFMDTITQNVTDFIDDVKTFPEGNLESWNYCADYNP